MSVEAEMYLHDADTELKVTQYASGKVVLTMTGPNEHIDGAKSQTVTSAIMLENSQWQELKRFLNQE